LGKDRPTAAGSSSTVIDYSFLDIHPQGSLLLYRLKQIDIDNRSKYSGIVRIASKGAATDLQAYPNPFREQVSVSIYAAAQQQVLISILDAAGRTVKTTTKDLYAGQNNIMLSGLGSFAKGIYHITAYDAAGNLLGRTQVLRE
jgi:hypothetical protein